MKFQLLVLPEAEQDIAEAFDWYEARRPGLGHEFITAVDAALKRIQQNPLSFPLIHRNARRILLRKFPYIIYFVFETALISVVACFHAKRAPSKWKHRLT